MWSQLPPIIYQCHPLVRKSTIRKSAWSDRAVSDCETARRTFCVVWSRSSRDAKRRRIVRVSWLVDRCSWILCNSIRGLTVSPRKTSKRRGQTQRLRYRWVPSAIHQRHCFCSPIRKSARLVKRTLRCLDNIFRLTWKVIRHREPVHFTSSRSQPMIHLRIAVKWVKTPAMAALRRNYRQSVDISRKARNPKMQARSLTQKRLAPHVKRRNRIKRRNLIRSYEVEVARWI